MLCAIPLEIAVRELNGMLYQALHLAKRGMPTLIGERMVRRIALGSGNPVLYFDSDQSVRDNTTVLENGGLVFNVNPEGMHIAQTRETLRNFARIAGCFSLVCAWGRTQVADIRSVFPEAAHDRILATGYPPFDLVQERFRPFHERQAIIDAHGRDYVLINTSFAIANNTMGFDRYIKMLAGMDEWKIFGEDAFLKLQHKVRDHQLKMLDAVADLACRLSEIFPDRHVIIRPHPGEDHSFYERSTAGRKNIFVRRDGTAREWIASAGAVVHHDCTTGMEALLMGRPVIQYRQYFDPETVAPLMTAFGVETRTPDEVADCVRHETMPEDIREAQLRILEPYYANFRTSAAAAIADLAVQHAGDRKTWLPEPLGFWDNLKCWRKYASKLLRAKQPGRNGKKVRYALNKFPRLRLDDVEFRLEALRRAEPDLPRVRVTQLTLNAFVVRPSDS